MKKEDYLKILDTYLKRDAKKSLALDDIGPFSTTGIPNIHQSL
jgi:hypothetical protein